eukprot:1160611-Pelagomonas_calceolata.AAC.2
MTASPEVGVRQQWSCSEAAVRFELRAKRDALRLQRVTGYRTRGGLQSERLTASGKLGQSGQQWSCSMADREQSRTGAEIAGMVRQLQGCIECTPNKKVGVLMSLSDHTYIRFKCLVFPTDKSFDAITLESAAGLQ